MATLSISYFQGSALGVAKGPMGHENLTTSATTAEATQNPGASIVGLYSDAAHYVKVGADATATNGMRLPASTLVFLAIDAGQEINAITA